MCNAGCTIAFIKINCTISYHGRTIICSSKCTHTGLGMVPLTENAGDQAANPAATTNHTPLIIPSTTTLAANIDATSSATKCARYIHQIMCSPPALTLLQTLDLSEELATIPGITTALIKNHLPHSTATNKGHMHQHQASTASMSNVQSRIIAAYAEVDRMFPPQEICTVQDVFCFTMLADAITSTIYSNITGAFPVCTFKSMQYMIVA
jgi:hypothetical protein